MLLREREWKVCEHCNSRTELLHEEEYGCDYCGKVIGEEHLDFTVFNRSSDYAKRYEFCSWICVLRKLKKLKSDYFIDMPMLHFDDAVKGQRAKDFWLAIKELGKSGK